MMMKKFTLLALVSLLWVGCGEDDEKPATNNPSTNNQTTPVNNQNNPPNNNTANNSQNNSNNVTTPPNNTTNPNNTIDEPYISSFRWISRQEDCNFAGCDRGFELATVPRTISNFDGRAATVNGDADWQVWAAAALNAAIIDRMVNGWNCPAEAEDGELSYRIEARIQDNGPTLHNQVITGCVESNDPDTVAILAALDLLQRTYLP